MPALGSGQAELAPKPEKQRVCDFPLLCKTNLAGTKEQLEIEPQKTIL